MNSKDALAAATREVQALPYAWPGEATASYVRVHGRGTCAGKHALLRERLELLGFRVNRLMVVGPLAPPIWPDLAAASDGIHEVHECLTVETDWAGPLLVDVTWHPAAIRAGLRGTLNWDGSCDMTCAVETRCCYSVGGEYFRTQKELVRSRLYSPTQRRVRDSILAEIALRANELS